MEHIEVYGERHREIRKAKMNTNREELGDLFIKLGEAFKRGVFDISEPIPSIEPERIELVEPLVFKFLYAHEEGGLELELEVEWSQSRVSQMNDIHGKNGEITSPP